MSIGTIHGWRGSYSSPQGVTFDALVLRPESPTVGTRPDAIGAKLACVGWQAVVVYDNTVFVASSGTPQKTRTPETPVVMEKTAVAETTDEAETLLSFAPALTRERIATYSVECSR